VRNITCETEEEKKMPEFKVWSRDNLDKFATDAYIKLLEQEDLIQQLQCDLKDAIAAYRELMRRGTQPQ
jgi:hypothetical protein